MTSPGPVPLLASSSTCLCPASALPDHFLAQGPSSEGEQLAGCGMDEGVGLGCQVRKEEGWAELGAASLVRQGDRPGDGALRAGSGTRVGMCSPQSPHRPSGFLEEETGLSLEGVCLGPSCWRACPAGAENNCTGRVPAGGLPAGWRRGLCSQPPTPEETQAVLGPREVSGPP